MSNVEEIRKRNCANMVGRLQGWMQNDYLTSVFWDEHGQMIDAAIAPILEYIIREFSPPPDHPQGAISPYLIPMLLDTYRAHLPTPDEPSTSMRRQRKLTIFLVAMATFEFVVDGIASGNLKLNSKIGFQEWLSSLHSRASSPSGWPPW